jgi:nucleoside-diphosphate-sugar epimerase
MGESQVQASAKLTAWLALGGGVAITGASGWVGRALIHTALQAMDAGAPGRLRLFGSQARMIDVAGRTLSLEALQNPAPLGEGEWIVAHLAVAGADRHKDPQARRQHNEAMLAEALALTSTGRVRRFVSASSGAVYAAPQPDPDKQAYNELKRDQEQIVRAWAVKAGAPVLIPRIFNVGGPYMNHAERYALGDMILQARRNGRIRIEAQRPVLRAYVHVLELAQVIFELALDSAASITFDAAGSEVVEMTDLAAAVARALALPDMVVERPPLETGAEPDRYVGDAAAYRAALKGPPVNLDAIIRDTAAWLAPV